MARYEYLISTSSQADNQMKDTEFRRLDPRVLR